jgi:hypothetical protein
MSRLLAYLVVCGIYLSSAQASVTTFNDRVAWTSNANGAAEFFEDFNRFGFQTVDFSQQPVVFDGNFSLFSTGLSGSSQRVTLSTATTIDGSPHARMFVNSDEPTTVRMNFITPVKAWGADMGRVEDCCEMAVVDVYFRGESLANETVVLKNGFNGFIASRAVTALVFRSDSLVPGPQGQPFGVDNIAGFTVPEPSCWLMIFACGLIGRRNRHP